MLEIDGSRYSGSGTIVRQAVAFAALTRQDVHITNARARRRRAGLRRQHVRAIEAICELAGGTLTGCVEDSRELEFRPGRPEQALRYTWDIGSAGSTTMLTLAVLPVLAFAGGPVEVEVRGGVFQDFAPSYYHLAQVVLPLLARMGVDAAVEMRRPGYIPSGGGILLLTVRPASGPLRPLVLDESPGVSRLWGIALSSHLEERRVSHRMADAAQTELASAGLSAEIETRYDDTALQRGAALAVFADLAGGTRMGADRAGALRRSAEAIGRYVARQLLEDLRTGAAVDRHAADQLIPYAALAGGESRFRIPEVTEHVLASAWLAREFFDASVGIEDNVVTVMGAGFRPRPPGAVPVPMTADRPAASVTGAPLPDPPALPPLTLAIAGDVMLGRLVNETIATEGFAYPWGDVLPARDRADLFLINLECALTASTRRWSDGREKAFYFRAEPSAVETLRLGRVDFVALANNHASDFGDEGLGETLRVLDEAGIAHAGAGPALAAARTPARLTSNGVRVAVVAFADHPRAWAATDRSPGINFATPDVTDAEFAGVRSAIAEARRDADVVVFSIHWGPNMRARPTAAFREFAHQAIDAGADIFWGHSAHVVQGIELWHRGVILYDTGDFIDDYAIDRELRNDLSALFFVRVAPSGVEQVELLPVQIDDMQVNVARGSAREWFIRRVRTVCAEMGTQVVVVASHDTLTVRPAVVRNA